MNEPPVLWLCGLTVLAAYLCVSVALRWHAEEAARRERERQAPGSAFDVSVIAPQIQRLRQNYCAAAHTRSQNPSYKAKLVAAARQLVTALAYFRRATPEDELHRHEA